MRRFLTIVCCLIGATAVAGCAPSESTGEAVELRWRLDKGRVFFQDVTVETNLRMMGEDFPSSEMKQKRIYRFRYEILDNDIDGNFLLVQRFERGQFEIAPIPLPHELVQALVGAEFMLTLDPDMSITRIEGRETLLTRLQQADASWPGLLNSILSEEAHGLLAEGAFVGVAPRPVKKGEVWTKESLRQIAIGRFKMVLTHTYEGQMASMGDRIRVDVTPHYLPPAPDSANQLPFRVKSGQIGPGSKGSGVIWFDRTNGRLDRAELSGNLECSLTVDLGGKDTKVKLVEAQTQTVRISE